MTPHRTRYQNLYEVGGRPTSRLPHDVKRFASNETREREQYGEMGMLGFWGAVAIAFALACALILVAFALPEDVPATVPSAEYGRAPR